jgi:hypothetical protein
MLDHRKEVGSCGASLLVSELVRGATRLVTAPWFRIAVGAKPIVSNYSLLFFSANEQRCVQGMNLRLCAFIVQEFSYGHD